MGKMEWDKGAMKARREGGEEGRKEERLIGSVGIVGGQVGKYVGR